jgi:uncharacterized protein HemX
MEEKEIRAVVAALRNEENETRNPGNKMLAAIIVGLAIALGGNFIGWFANKNTSDVENVTTINKTLEFMQLQQNATNDALRGQIDELKKQLETISEKLAAPRFTREDFNREMIYRDQDVRRIQAQVEEVLDKIDEISRRK